MKLKITLAILLPILMLFGAWVAGFNFNERGQTALFVYFLAVWSAFMGVLFANMIEAQREMG